MGDAKAVVELAEAEGATILAGVPTIWINLLATLRADRSAPAQGAHRVSAAARRYPTALMEWMDALGLRMLHAWGMTETSPLGSVRRPRSRHEPEDELEPAPDSRTRRCRASRSASSISATGEELPWDGVAFGEIQVRGPWIATRLPQRLRPGQAHRGRLVPHRRCRQDRTRRLHPDRRSHQGRDQVGRRVDLVGRPRERDHGAPEGPGGGRDRPGAPEVAGAAGRLRRPKPEFAAR